MVRILLSLSDQPGEDEADALAHRALPRPFHGHSAAQARRGQLARFPAMMWPQEQESVLRRSMRLLKDCLRQHQSLRGPDR